MPIIKSAIKKLRQDKKRTARNRGIKGRYKKLLKEALTNPTPENVKRAVSVIDKAAKRNVIHKNKAARLKSKLMRMKAELGKKKTAVGKKGLEKGKKKPPRSTTRKKKATEIDRKKTKS